MVSGQLDADRKEQFSKRFDPIVFLKLPLAGPGLARALESIPIHTLLLPLSNVSLDFLACP